VFTDFIGFDGVSWEEATAKELHIHRSVWALKEKRSAWQRGRRKHFTQRLSGSGIEPLNR